MVVLLNEAQCVGSPVHSLPAGTEARKTDVCEDEMKLQFCLDALDDADPFALEVRLTCASLFLGWFKLCVRL